MAVSFTPVEELLLYCRFCSKTLPAVLERGIAGSGRTVDKNSTFEYICSKCHRSHCYYGNDIIEAKELPEEAENSEGAEKKESTEPVEEQEVEAREYKTTEHYLIGESISHPSYDNVGQIVGKEPGIPNRILVKFGKNITQLVEDIK